MVKFAMFLSKPEDIVFTTTAQSPINVGGQTINVGTHCVTFSGKAELKFSDSIVIWNETLNKDDKQITESECEVVCGPLWDEITQCSFVLSPSRYGNINADEDDRQGWQVNPKSWDPVLNGTGKRIRLNFTLASYGQNTYFYEVTYKVTATGTIPSTTPPPPPPPIPCDEKLVISDWSSSGSADINHNENKAIDSDANTFWKSTTIIHPHIILHLDNSPRKVCRVDIRWRDSRQYYFRISLGSTAGISMDVFSGKSSGNPNMAERYEFYEQICSFVQITVTESDASILPKSEANISEITVYGKPSK
jgi:hypothetical protein